MTIDEKFLNLSEQIVKKKKNIFVIPHSKWSSRHLFSILVKNRPKVIKKLKKKG